MDSDLVKFVLGITPRSYVVQSVLNPGVVVEDGYYINTRTGHVLYQCCELDDNNGYFQPLYHYNRSWRFVSLFHEFQIPIESQRILLRTFELLERVWEETKSKYKRVYFLTQKVLLQEITRRLCIASTQPTKRPISDIRRYQQQILIFDDLWKFI
jgi:hypothetical protein